MQTIDHPSLLDTGPASVATGDGAGTCPTPARSAPGGPPARPRAWTPGERGEAEVAALLADCDGVVALHDRRPTGRAPIDHVVVAPSGVWVIDTRRYVGASVAFARAGDMLSPDERLLVSGIDQTALVEEMPARLESVAAAAGGTLAGVPVHPVLCFVDARWGRPAWRFCVRGVTVCAPRDLAGLVAAPGPLDPEVIFGIADTVARALPGS